MDKRMNQSSVKNEEFEEEEVWSVLKEGEEVKPISDSTQDHIFIASKRFPSAARMIRRSLGSEQQSVQSAPVNVPDWSRINGKKVSDGSEEDEDEDSMVPPHKWLANKMEKREMMSFSVCEGAGRTLKGRDLMEMRNVVLTKTGFLE
ncbi:uncharacterized protein LOC124910815 [Impatiens glandulifera]|uniref:uncharacterized protein LOC124910815 n=1 Tax=Impatiens glandulifera TaxID=253017 RepID=UPI001FB0651D|nr:uncharacterized protein LOC124910815 [Impatiens glandulifera]